MPDAPIFIGLAGHSGSGKSSAAEYLVSRYGFDSVRYSRVLQEWLREPSESKSRLQEIGWEVMASGRQAELNAQLISRLNTRRSSVIDGLRHPIDFACLSHAFGDAFALIFIQAKRSQRIERTLPRFGSLAQFEFSEEQPVESFIAQLLRRSSAVVMNDGSLEDFHAQISRTLEQLFPRMAA